MVAGVPSETLIDVQRGRIEEWQYCKLFCEYPISPKKLSCKFDF